MKPREDRRVGTLVTAVLGAVLFTVGCSSTNGSGYKEGDLGNGGFYFSCEDAVSCQPYSNDAAKFPKAVSLSSSFSVRFVPQASSNTVHITFNESAPDRGITVAPVGEFVSRGPKGLVAVKSGYATLASRDASGDLIDYVVIRVVMPDALVVYDAGESTSSPRPVDKIKLATDDRATYRAFAQAKKENLAGTLQLEWTSSDPTILDVESATDGAATVVAKAPGTATLTATGGTFTQKVAVEVTQ